MKKNSGFPSSLAAAALALAWLHGPAQALDAGLLSAELQNLQDGAAPGAAQAPELSLPQAPALEAFKGPSGGQPLGNFAQVSPVLYRSAQPSEQGVSQLAADGVKTILKLNADDPAEQDWAAADGITLVDQLMDNHSSPSYSQVDAALAVINDPARQPVLVHCHKGADRTGTVVAAYRVVVQKMSVAQAVAEAKSFHYGSPGFQDLTAWLNGYLAQRAGK